MTGVRLTQAAGVALAVALMPIGIGGCDTGSPAAPVFVGAGTGEVADASIGDAGPNYAVCPPDIDASFASILTKMLATSSCGTDRAFNCHSASGAAATGTGNLLDLTVDAAAVYNELVGPPDGGGVYATNLSGDASVLRVAPGDASASMLYIKLILTTTMDPQYGAGMPLDNPGSVCPAALDAVRAWIDRGAAPN
jgi:hypothetical protein